MEARLCFIGHGLMENRSGLIVDARLTRVSGHAERLAALDMVQHVADRPCRPRLRRRRFRRGIARHERAPARDAEWERPALGRSAKRTTRHPGYAKSLRIPKRIEEAFGWIKTVAGLRRPSSGALPRSIGRSPLPPPTIWCGRPS
jgi:hypothetical protein